MNQSMSKRVALTIPEYLYADLERWAKQQGRPIANLASFLIEVSVREAIEKGELKPEQSAKKEKK